MKIRETCPCGASVEATDESAVEHDFIRAAKFVEKWRDQHVCPVEEPAKVDVSGDPASWHGVVERPRPIGLEQ